MQARYPNMHVWPRRALESCFLEPSLIAAVMVSAGQDVSIDEVSDWLLEKAHPLREDVLAQLVEQELARRVPPPDVPESGDRYQKMAGHLKSYADVNLARAEAVDAVVVDQRSRLEARWSNDWAILVDPKPLIAQLAGGIRPIFKNGPAIMSALVTRAREDLDVRPASLEALRLRLAELLGSERA